MRKPTLLPALRSFRLALFGLAVLLTVLALMPLQAQIATKCNGYIYCTTWGWADGCCFYSGGYHGRQQRTCTDGIGHYCTEYRCTSGACAI